MQPDGLRASPLGHDFGVGLLPDGSYRFWLPRRLVLARWSLFSKYWPACHLPLARMRSLYWVIVRGHTTEICGRCGRPVAVVFHTPDDVWEIATGFGRYPGGEAAPGVLCPPCVDALVTPKIDGYLSWTCEVTR